MVDRRLPPDLGCEYNPDGAFLYADTGASGIVDGFAINVDGSLTALTPVLVPGGADLEGIVAI